MQRSMQVGWLESHSSSTGTNAAWGSRAARCRFAWAPGSNSPLKTISIGAAGADICSGAASTSGRCQGWRPLRAAPVPATAASMLGAAATAGGAKRGSRADDDDLPGLEGEGAARLATARRLKMVVAYDGSEFAGFQFQPGKVRTVQGELERCAKRLFHGSSRMVGASRTDGGAHAHGQVVHFDVYGTRDSLESDVLYYNSFLPPDVRVLGLSYAEDGFDSHFSSCGKTYLYKFAAGLPDPTQAKYRWWVYDRWCERSRGKPGRLCDVELDVGRMSQAAELLLGRHDFTAFMDNKRPAGLGSAKRKNPKLAERGIKPERTSAKNTRILSHLQLRESLSPVSGGQEVEMEVTGNGFLYRMVRMLAAGLVEVGHRRLSPEGLRELMLRADRSALPEAAPPHGLYLARVHYPGDTDFESRIQSLADRIRAGSAGSQLRQSSDGSSGRSAGSSLGGVAVAGEGGPGGDAVGEDGEGPQGTQAVVEGDEAESVVRELRLSQGQKAAALMRAAAAERRGGAGAAAAAGGGGPGGGGGAPGASSPSATADSQSEDGSPPVGEPELDFSLLREREDDQ
ncbi:hypothetical protein PLESTB_000759800 [Pleodorina starrii]|uniref:Pseudouridine synthase I TruA alpha/beta domain-containing protein n=1 Tax=Pleodorina starrii TaxID=330485 RepID=A0A9W6F241_9CHLO|nr:hypothetical protein PLESTB_000759800 [Pleodorina starrii]GLC65769.1 hypothetical protein PLESTF_000338000 [Pleodorina starrii]